MKTTYYVMHTTFNGPMLAPFDTQAARDRWLRDQDSTFEDFFELDVQGEITQASNARTITAV